MLFKVVVYTTLCLTDFFLHFLEDCIGLFEEVDSNFHSSCFTIIFISLISRLDAAEVGHVSILFCTLRVYVMEGVF